MLNWIEGSLKLRGTHDDILRFFNEGIMVYHSEWDSEKKECNSFPTPKETWMRVKDFEDGTDIDILDNKWTYVEGTKGAFITTEHNVTFIEKEPKPEDSTDDPIVVTACEVHQAWCFRPEEWLELSEKYNLDIRLYGIEKNYLFWQELIIQNGEISKFKTESYSGDYDAFIWECPFPWLGG